MKFIDLSVQQEAIREELDVRIAAVLAHGQYIMGPEINELENVLRKFVGVRHCTTVSSGTDALLISLMALGIGPGDEVITTPFTFISTVEVIVLLGGSSTVVIGSPNQSDCQLFQTVPNEFRIPANTVS